MRPEFVALVAQQGWVTAWRTAVENEGDGAWRLCADVLRRATPERVSELREDDWLWIAGFPAAATASPHYAAREIPDLARGFLSVHVGPARFREFSALTRARLLAASTRQERLRLVAALASDSAPRAGDEAPPASAPRRRSCPRPARKAGP